MVTQVVTGIFLKSGIGKQQMTAAERMPNLSD